MRAANACGNSSFEELTDKFCTAQTTVTPNTALADTYEQALKHFATLLEERY